MTQINLFTPDSGQINHISTLSAPQNTSQTTTDPLASLVQDFSTLAFNQPSSSSNNQPNRLASRRRDPLASINLYESFFQYEIIRPRLSMSISTGVKP